MIYSENITQLVTNDKLRNQEVTVVGIALVTALKKFIPVDQVDEDNHGMFYKGLLNANNGQQLIDLEVFGIEFDESDNIDLSDVRIRVTIDQYQDGKRSARTNTVFTLNDEEGCVVEDFNQRYFEGDQYPYLFDVFRSGLKAEEREEIELRWPNCARLKIPTTPHSHRECMFLKLGTELIDLMSA